MKELFFSVIYDLYTLPRRSLYVITNVCILHKILLKLMLIYN